MIYLDHAATTPTDSRVVEKMIPYFSEKFFNPSLGYRNAVRVRSDISEARNFLAQTIKAREDEIYFCSGGTEGDNLAIRGVANAYKEKGRHIISTKIEHPAVYETLKSLEKEGFVVTLLDVDSDGQVNPEDIRTAICDDTILVSVMYANNETGVIQPIEEIGKITAERNIVFHCDAVQAYGHVDIDVNKLKVDLLTVSSHKIYGPKGVGLLYIRTGIKVSPLNIGGKQEKKIRGGTENVPAIIGFFEAARLLFEEKETRRTNIKNLSNKLCSQILNDIPDCKLNGSVKDKLPGTLNFSFAGIEGETLLIQLDMKGICVSTGSACSFGNGEISRSLISMGLTEEEARGSLRISIGYENTEEEIEEVFRVLRDTIEYMRSLKI